jgi:hypothetical protein
MAKKRKSRKQIRPRLRLSGRTFKLGDTSPFKGRSWNINPYLREVGMSVNPRRRRRRSYRLNPAGMFGGATGAIGRVVSNPVKSVMDGLTGALAMYMTIAIPNWLLPFPGTDLMSKGIRLATRVAAGGLLVAIFPQESVKQGASIGALGGSALDFFNTRVIIGSGDVGQTPLALLAPVTGMTAYSRPMLPAARGLNAYSTPMTAAARGLAAYSRNPGMSGINLGHRLF